MGKRRRWELIIFDRDGVLVDTEPVANRVLTEVLNEIGLSVSYDETVRQFMGLPTATCVEIIEARLASFSGSETALLFGSGYAANIGLLQAVVSPDDLVVSDASNHASLIDGIRLTKAPTAIYPHQDLHALEAALSRPRSACRCRR